MDILLTSRWIILDNTKLNFKHIYKKKNPNKLEMLVLTWQQRAESFHLTNNTRRESTQEPERGKTEIRTRMCMLECSFFTT